MLLLIAIQRNAKISECSYIIVDLSSLERAKQLIDINQDKFPKSASYIFILPAKSRKEADRDAYNLFLHPFFNKAINSVLLSHTSTGIAYVYLKDIKSTTEQKQVDLFDYWNGHRFLFKKDIFPDKLQDFGGKVLKVTTFNHPPYTYQEESGEYGGYEYRVVAALANNMNFELDINPPPNGEKWGENKNGTFTGKEISLQ